MFEVESESIAAIAGTEAKRLTVLENLRILDTPPERAFDTIVRSARSLLDCPIALISLVDDRRQWFKAKCGLTAEETPRSQAFCAHAIQRDDLMVVPDAHADLRFADNPLVIGPPFVRFYAGMPILMNAEDGDLRSFAMGTLCVIDFEPRELTEADAQTLRDLAHLVESLLHARASARLATGLAEEQRAVVRELDRAHRQFRQAERMANIGSWRVNIADQTTVWSDQVFAIHDLPIGQMPPLNAALDYLPPFARAEITAALARTIATGEPMDIETDLVTAKGRTVRVRTMGELDRREGLSDEIIGVFQDITESYEVAQSLRLTASLDELTGISNRARFNVVANERIAALQGRDDAMVLLLIDLDNFKAVNDRCGHLAGDDLLRLMATRLNAPWLEGSFPARLGGDEFVLIINDPKALTDLDGVIRRLLSDLRHVVSCEGAALPVSATIGAAWLTADVRDRSELLHRADIALYDAKRVRKGSARVFGRTGALLPADPWPHAITAVR